jgi:phage terminase large subunit
MKTTKVFSQLLAAFIDPAVRTIIMKGGTRSGKTWAILQLLNIIASKSTTDNKISIVSETFPHLRLGAMTDFVKILEGDLQYNPSRWSASTHTYLYNRAQIEFFSADMEGRVQGPSRDYLYLNEATNIKYSVYRQLAIRTAKKIIIDYNPLFYFWAEEKVLNLKGSVLIHSTYKDNEFCPPQIVEDLLKMKDADPEWYRIFGEGETGTGQSIAIRNWDIVPELPPKHLRVREYIGVDFGYSAPSAIMHIIQGEGNEIYIDEIAFRQYMDNPDIAEAIKAEGLQDLVTVCDSAEPKSIYELQACGINAIATTNKDIMLGLKIMNRYKKHYTARSVNAHNENKNLHFLEDRSGNITENLSPGNDHTIDAERYVFLTYFGEQADLEIEILSRDAPQDYNELLSLDFQDSFGFKSI